MRMCESIDMSPSFALNDALDLRSTHAETLSELLVSSLTSGMDSTNLAHIVFGQLRGGGVLPVKHHKARPSGESRARLSRAAKVRSNDLRVQRGRMTALGNHVLHVVPVASRKHVVGVDALVVIAAVASENVRGNQSVRHLKGRARSLHATNRRSDTTSAVFLKSPRPQPTRSEFGVAAGNRSGFVDLRPEPLLKGSIEKGVAHTDTS